MLSSATLASLSTRSLGSFVRLLGAGACTRLQLVTTLLPQEMQQHTNDAYWHANNNDEQQEITARKQAKQRTKFLICRYTHFTSSVSRLHATYHQ